MSGTIDAPIGRHPNHDYKWAVTAEGKPSVTHYDLIEAFRAASLLDIKLETGRTHQIRVHMSAHRHPCVGDLTYGADPTIAKRLGLTRQWLHAVQAGLRAPLRRPVGRVRERLPGRSPARPRHDPGRERVTAFRVRLAEDAADREACFAVREQVFVVEQQVPEDVEYDAYDAIAVHVLAAGPGAPRHRAACCTGPGRWPRRGPRASARSAGSPSPRRPAVSASARPWSAPSRTRPVSAASPRWTCTRRRRRWASTSGSGTRRTARSSRTRGSRTGRCGGRFRSRPPRAALAPRWAVRAGCVARWRP